MTSTLPRRPYAGVQPPPDGLEQVRHEAGRRRRRKLVAAAGGGAGALAVVAAVAFSAAGGGLAVLEPAPPAHQVVPAPSVSPSPGVAPRWPALTKADPHPGRAGHRAATATGPARVAGPAGRHPPDTAERSPTGTTVGSSVARGSDVRTPELQRWRSTYTAGPRECTGSTYGGTDGSLHSAVGWCLDVAAARVSGGVRLSVQLCRDSTGGGTLSFAGSREVDLAVRQGGHRVWDWARLHPGGAGAHQVSVEANGCWNWSLVWPDLATDGSPAGHGTFTFVGTSTAEEMKGGSSDSVAFSY